MDKHPPLPATVLRHWRVTVTCATASTVLPDGCRDLIVACTPGERPRWFVSPLADTTLVVPGVAGQRFAGFRFHPAVRLNEAGLLAAAAASAAEDPLDLRALVEEHVRLDARVAEALEAVAQTAGIAAACRRLGVSERSLERLLKQRTGRSPAYWKGLARARHATAALAAELPLAEIAADHGYADQAHMTRDFRKWFATTPARFRADPERMAMAIEPGYG